MLKIIRCCRENIDFLSLDWYNQYVFIIRNLEVSSVTSRNWVKLFFTTLLIGGITTAIVGFIVRWNEFQPYFTEFKIFDIFSTFIWLLGMGFLFSLISQLGFFAYLTVHRFGLGIFKSVSLWNGVQVVLILFALYDLVDWRYVKFAEKGESIFSFFIPAVILIVVSLATAWVKMKQTNREAFIPALFVMIVVTLVEWVPAIKVNERSWLYLMMFGLMACNAYQLLILHKLNAKSVEERQKRASEKADKQRDKVTNKIAKKPSI
jgi:KinB signaling pathway activation protein